MPARRSPVAGRSIRILGWMVLFYVLGEVALGCYVSWINPKVRDWEYGTILTGLKARLAESPHRPVVVVLGSSRPAGAFRFSALPPGPSGIPDPVVFNCSAIASGPIRELQVFRRLLHDGIRPDYLFVEVWSPYLVQREDWFEENLIRKRDLEPIDYGILSYCCQKRTATRRLWLETQLAPSVAFRHGLLEQFVPDLLPPPEPFSNLWLDPARRHEEDGWFDPPGDHPDPQRAAWDLAIWKLRLRQVCDPFQVHPPADRALRTILRTAREKGIATYLLLCPDHSGLRGPAGMDTWPAYVAYLQDLSREYGSPVIDTRDWVADEGFSDFVHLSRTAAAPYTRRFGREVLDLLLAGAPLSSHLLFPLSATPSSSLAQTHPQAQP
jgi:hypothetical protein